MAYSYVLLPGDGSNTVFSFSFPYLDQAHVGVKVDGVTTAFTWLTGSSISVSPAPANGTIVEVRRVTPKDEAPVNFSDGSVLLEADLDLLAEFNLYCAQESQDLGDDSVTFNSQGIWDGQGRSTTNFADPTEDTGLVTKGYLDGAYGDQIAADKVAVAASAASAASSASASQGYAALADASSDSAAALLALFRGQYLGALASTPTVDGNGSPVTSGDLYFDTAVNAMKVYNGASWQNAGSTIEGVVDAPIAPVTITPGHTSGGVTTVPVPGGYDAGFITAFVNGTKYSSPDVVTSSGTDLVFSPALGDGDEVSWVAYSAFSVANVYTQGQLNASGGIALIGGSAHVVSSIAELKTLLKTHYSKCAFVTGYYAAGDGGGGAYYLDAADTTSLDNGGSIIVAADGGRWKLADTLEYAVEQFGAKGGTDSTAAFIAAAATGKPLRIGYGDFTINSPVTIAQRVRGSGADDGQTTITLTGTGQIVIGDWNASIDGFLLRSAVNSKTFVKCPGMSYFHCTNFRIEKTGAATGQIGIDFDTTTASIYFCNVDYGRFKVDYPIRIFGNSSQVFNANNIGSNTGTLYFQNFLSAITIDGTTACDTNNFAGYFEVGTNIISHVTGALRQNRFRLVSDAVTRVYNTSVAVTDPNIWELPDGLAFTYAGTFPTNQVFVGGGASRVRATASSGQSLTSAVNTKLTYNAETFDSLSEFVTDTFTAKQSGYYSVAATVRSASAAWPAGSRIQLFVYKNGVEYEAGDWNPTEAAVTVQRGARVSALVSLAAGDTLDIRAIHNQGGSLALDTAPTANVLTITRLP